MSALAYSRPLFPSGVDRAPFIRGTPVLMGAVSEIDKEQRAELSGLLTVKQAADRLGTTEGQVYRWLAQREVFPSWTYFRAGVRT